MRLSRLILFLIFVLFASAALAAKPEKSLVCHVGSDRGSADQAYLDNIDCTPTEGWDVEVSGEFNCPEAGKVDLILVSTKAKHVGNPSHSFDDDGYLWEDYTPEDGIGDDPADFEEGDVLGIDRGCELPEVNLACPCWSDFTPSEFVSIVDLYSYQAGEPSAVCDSASLNPTYAVNNNAFNVYLVLYARYQPPTCQAYVGDGYLDRVFSDTLTADEQASCVTELRDLIPRFSACD